MPGYYQWSRNAVELDLGVVDATAHSNHAIARVPPSNSIIYPTSEYSLDWYAFVAHTFQLFRTVFVRTFTCKAHHQRH